MAVPPDSLVAVSAWPHERNPEATGSSALGFARRRASGGNPQHGVAAPGIAGGNLHGPQSKNLRALVHAFESQFGFGDGFNRRDPELSRGGRLDGRGDILPPVDNAQRSAERSRGHGRSPAQLVLLALSLEVAVGLGGREQGQDAVQDQ